MNHQQPIQAMMDIGAIGILVGYFFDHLPAVATGLTVIYYLIRIYKELRNR
jgi:hypothetical protein